MAESEAGLAHRRFEPHVALAAICRLRRNRAITTGPAMKLLDGDEIVARHS
jgi:hypothetical protein